MAVIGAYQLVSGAYRSDFYDSDSAGHFVTGVMIADYLRTAAGTNPLRFAERFYIHSPQVTFGRSPPVFHLLEGAWLCLFGTTQVSALVLMAVIAAAATYVLFRRLGRLYGMPLAVMGAMLFASMRLVRWHSRIIMSDLLTLLLCTLTALAVADFARSRRSRDLMWMTVWLVTALLTKENALHLLLLAPGFLTVTCGREILKQRWFVAAAAVSPVLLIGGVAALILSGAGIHGYRDLGSLLRRSLDVSDSPEIFWALLGVAPWPVFALATAGVWFGIRDPGPPDVRRHVLLASIWLVSLLLFFLVAPAPASSRYFMPALVPLVLLSVHALNAVRTRLEWHSPRLAALACGGICLAVVLVGASPLPGNSWGYGPVAASLPVRPNLVTLIASDPYGDGAFVVERLMTDRQQQGFVLRADKVLAASDWMGSYYSLQIRDLESLAAWLDSVPVHYLVLDRFARPGVRIERHRELLARLVEEHPERYHEVGRFPLHRRGVTFPEAITVYRNTAAKTYGTPRVELDLGDSLGRTLRLSDAD